MLSYGVPLGITMMNMSEIRFETSFITVLNYVIYHFSYNTEMYTSGIHFRAYHHAFSLTRKRVPVVRNFVPIITLPVQHGNVYQRYTFSCLPSRFQFNTETCTSGAQFRAYHHASSPTRFCKPGFTFSC